jgi:hypothetical protein
MTSRVPGGNGKSRALKRSRSRANFNIPASGGESFIVNSGSTELCAQAKTLSGPPSKSSRIWRSAIRRLPSSIVTEGDAVNARASSTLGSSSSKENSPEVQVKSE